LNTVLVGFQANSKVRIRKRLSETYSTKMRFGLHGIAEYSTLVVMRSKGLEKED